MNTTPVKVSNHEEVLNTVRRALGRIRAGDTKRAESDLQALLERHSKVALTSRSERATIANKPHCGR